MKKLRLPIFLTLFIFALGFFLAKTSPVWAEVAIEETFCKGDAEIRTSRPTECYVCNQNNLLTPSCATTFTLNKEIEYQKTTTQEKIPWESRFNIDVSETTLPFAGLGGKESENDYLADYFEGTNEYYRNYGNQTTLTNYQGILRKLTPLEYQNQLKKQLITRAPKEGVVKENPINDYKVVYTGRFCWDVPFWMDAGRYVFNEIFDQTINRVMAFIKNLAMRLIPVIKFEEKAFELKLPDIGHYCLYKDSESSGPGGWLIVAGLDLFHHIPGFGKIGDILAEVSQRIPGLVHLYPSTTTFQENLTTIAQHQPPSPNEENYIENYLAWKKSGPEDGKEEGYWYKLWQVVPMLSREDTPGDVKPYIGEDPDVSLIVDDENDRLEKVPHLARLFEGSQIINQLLIPETSEEIEKQVSEDFPETNPPTECFKENYLEGAGDGLCCGNIPGSVEGQLENPYFNECAGKIATSSADRCYGVAKENIIQGVGIKLSHPYLDEIWHNTTYPQLGFFNIFRPHQFLPFEDIDAASTIAYSSSNSEVSPKQGLFFFPHLGGIQKAKEWVVNQALWPECNKEKHPGCPN